MPKKVIAKIEVYHTKAGWKARHVKGRKTKRLLAGYSYSTRMNARRAARKAFPDLDVVSV